MKVQDQHQIKPKTQSCQTSVTGSAVFHGDCLEIMKSIPDESIDMILCDLPYGTTACKWDVIIPFDKLWEQYERIIKKNGAIVLFGSEPFSSHLRMSKINLYRYDVIWDKIRGSNFALANKQPLKTHENISVFYKKLPIYNPQMTKGMPYNKTKYNGVIDESNITGHKIKRIRKENKGERFPVSIQRFSMNWKRQDQMHPTQKPTELFEYLIKTYTNEGDLVLDNCAGSGTTGISCLNTNRKYILIEKNENYINIIKNRIMKKTLTQNGIAIVSIGDGNSFISMRQVYNLTFDKLTQRIENSNAWSNFQDVDLERNLIEICQDDNIKNEDINLLISSAKFYYENAS